MDRRIEELSRMTENHHDILSHQRFCFTTNGIMVNRDEIVVHIFKVKHVLRWKKILR